MDPIVGQDWLAQRLGSPNIVVVDCRFNMADPEEGKREYERFHIPGAVYFDLEEDMSGPVTEHGGRHPLPDPKTFAEKLGERGIDHTKTVIAYDDQNGAMAARFWWLLGYLGHPNVAVLDEGFSAWVKKGLPVSNDKPIPVRTQFIPNIQHDWVVPMIGVKTRAPEEVLVDARSPERYRGEKETIDRKAGHIPGAENWFWEDNLRDGKWRSAEELKERFRPLMHKPVTVYCGSGVTACANILAMKRAGLKNIKLYPGSWSDWISYPDNPIATGSE
ncbi:sulfurtransferase [Caenibacillus caldisaponilyticus]|uniref:sulfurtransferase n=1 Tax=Caenibacillus caldisaponilyticus TaxID=1674942 RepID=UPI0009882EF6|nr:sulfurtransferase [Caenibacillus caldisaponilyticus]